MNDYRQAIKYLKSVKVGVTNAYLMNDREFVKWFLKKFDCLTTSKRLETRMKMLQWVKEK